MRWIILLCLTSCGVNNFHFTSSDPILEKYFDDFQEKTGKFEIATSGFMTLEENTLAYCYSEGYKKEIVVDIGFWETSSKAEKELVVWHEMGHCFCDLDHDTKLLSDGCPATLMSENIPSKLCIDKYLYWYKLDLVSKCTGG